MLWSLEYFIKTIETVSPRRIIILVFHNIFKGSINLIVVVLSIINNFDAIAPEVIVFRGFIQDFVHYLILAFVVFSGLKDEITVVP